MEILSEIPGKTNAVNIFRRRIQMPELKVSQVFPFLIQMQDINKVAYEKKKREKKLKCNSWLSAKKPSQDISYVLGTEV